MKRAVDLLMAILLSFWWVVGLLTLDWLHLVMSSLGLWLLWRSREAEALLGARARYPKKAHVFDDEIPWPWGDSRL